MHEFENLRSMPDLVEASLQNADATVATIQGHEDEPQFVGYAEFGIPWNSGVFQSAESFEDITAYRGFVAEPNGAAWMDNTTLLTAVSLMSSSASEIVTPLTIWDLATFACAVVCYEHIYHHEHPSIGDYEVNMLLGAEVLRKVPLPYQEPDSHRKLPTPWDGAHRFICNTWDDSYRWLRRLHDSVGSKNLDGKELEAVTAAWRTALGNEDLQPTDLVDWRNVNTRSKCR